VEDVVVKFKLKDQFRYLRSIASKEEKIVEDVAYRSRQDGKRGESLYGSECWVIKCQRAILFVYLRIYLMRRNSMGILRFIILRIPVKS